MLTLANMLCLLFCFWFRYFFGLLKMGHLWKTYFFTFKMQKCPANIRIRLLRDILYFFGEL